MFASNRRARPAGSSAFPPRAGRGARACGSILAARQPAWSPDGIADRVREPALPAGRRVERTERTRGADAARSPVGIPHGRPTEVASSSASPGLRRSRGDLFVAAADGSSMRRITRTHHDDVSRPGRLTARASRSPRIVRSSARTTTRSTSCARTDGVPPAHCERSSNRSPAWSPDGALLAFVSGRKPGQFNPGLWTMRRDGGGEAPGAARVRPDRLSVVVRHEPELVAGRQLARLRDDQTFYPENVFIVRPDGQDKIDLTPETQSTDIDPAWQPVCSHPGTAERRPAPRHARRRSRVRLRRRRHDRRWPRPRRPLRRERSRHAARAGRLLRHRGLRWRSRPGLRRSVDLVGMDCERVRRL